MNATQTKTRARAKKSSQPAAPSASQPNTIDDIRRWILMAEEKIEMAYDAAERGAPIDTLLDHINHNVIVAPLEIIQRDDLTQSDVRRVYSGLFPVLACLQGAIKLAAKTAIGGTLNEAHQLLDAAQTALDSVEDAVRSLPEGGPVHNFARGRDLAIQFINEGSSLSGQRDCYRDHREPGTAQKDFASDYLMQAVDAPELLQGFAAVLSQIVGSSEGFTGEFFQRLTLAETKAGPAGADRTQGELRESSPASSPRSAFDATGIEENAYFMVNEVIEIIRSRQQDAGKDIVYGARYAVEHAYRILEAGVRACDMEQCKDASGPIAAAISVLEAAVQTCEDVALQGALRLLGFAHDSLDSATAEAL